MEFLDSEKPQHRLRADGQLRRTHGRGVESGFGKAQGRESARAGA